MECERCRDVQSCLALVRQSLIGALDAIQLGVEAAPAVPGRGAPSSCPHCSRCLRCGPGAEGPCEHRDGGVPASHPALRDAADRPHPGTEALTSREQEVLLLLADGLSNRRIARQLGIAEKTVKNHLAAIFAKLGVHARTEAAVYAIKAGMDT